ncbi:MAG: hypothetical protein R6V19_17055 [Armatimonadota bacterium]
MALCDIQPVTDPWLWLLGLLQSTGDPVARPEGCDVYCPRVAASFAAGFQ